MATAQQQDFWGQFEVAEYDKPQYDWGQFEEVPQNKHALESSLNELPDGDAYVQTQKHQTEQLANMLFTEDEIKAIQEKGQIGWWEYARNYADFSEAIPFYGTGKQVAEAGKTYAIAKKIENGEEVSEADKTYMVEYLKKYAETQLRGTTWGAKGATMLIQAPAFIGEFFATAGIGATIGKGAAIAGIKGAGVAATKAAIKAGSKIATSKALSTIAGREAVETIGTKAALEVSAELAGKTAAQQAVLVPMYAVQNYNERKIADGLNITDKGNDLVYDTQKADSKADWGKSFGIGEIEILSELSGGLLGYMAGGISAGITKAATKIGSKVATTNTARGISAISAKVYNSLPKDVRVKLEASARLTEELGSKISKAGEKLKQPAIGFHGTIEEMGEERLGDFLKAAFDLDENEGYSLDDFGSAIFPSWQQLLLEAGVFSIVGGASLATRTVANDLLNKGYSEKEATTITQNLSEIEKENMANDILGEVKINEDITEEEVQKEADAIRAKYINEGQIIYDLPHDSTAVQNAPVNDIITDPNKNLNPSELYDVENKAEKKQTAEPKTLKEVEKVAAEEAIQEEEEKGVKGLFKDFKETIQNFVEPLYTEAVDRFAPIQNTVKRANKKGADLGIDITDKNWIENPYNLARMYSGIANRIWQHFKENTTSRAEDGTQKITGEGFGKIIEDLYEQTKDIESDKETQLKDFEDYLIAKRYLLDLKDREGYEATEEQKLKAVKDMARIAEKYGDKMETLEKLAERVYEYNRRTLHLLVDSGNMSQETYDKIIADNPHHISYKRVMDDNYGTNGLSFAKGKFTDAKSPIKKIRGSEREIQSIYKSTLEDTMRIIDVAERNYIARKTAELQKYLPEEIKPIKPLMRKTTAKVKVTYDAKMRKQLEEAIKFFGRTFENVKSIKTPTGYALGAYSEQEKLVRKKLGSQDRTLAHEVGHMLDYALDVENKIKKNSAIMKEITQLAEDRFSSTVKLEDGEYVTEEAKNTEKYKNYVRSNKEMIANMFDLYFTSRDYVKRVAPETAKFIDSLFKGEYKFLNDIRPSSETATEEIEQDVWTQSPEKPSKNAIGYYEDGKLKFVEVEPNLMRSIEDLNPKQYGMIAKAVDKLFKTSSDWLRAGATLNPEFILRNPIRDVQEAWFNVDGFNPLIDVPKGLMAVIGKNNSSLYKEWQREGGSFNSYMELNEKTINEAVKLYEEKKPLIWKALGFVPNTLEKLSSTLEESTRLGIYNAMLRKGLTPTQAAFMSREGTLDFARGGRFIKQANRYLTFLNAGVQGTDRVLRTMINNPKQALKIGMTMAMGQILLSGYYLYLAPDDDRKEYLEIPEYVKNIAYVFKVGGKWWKIPRPFAPGYIFEAIPEKFITWLATNDKPEGLKLFNFAKDLFTAASPITDPSDFIPPMLKVWIENTSNHSFFTDRQIYPEYLNQYEAKERYTKNTSETAKLLGEKLNMSPALIENALRGQFGNAAKYALDMGDYMQNGIKKLVGEEVNEKPKDISNAWVVRGFAVKEPIGNQSQSLNTFYKNYKELSQIHSTYNKKKNESRQEAKEYQSAHKEELRQFKTVERAYKDIQELRKKSDKILKNKNLDGKEKAEKIKMLERQMTEKAQNANEFIKE